MNPVENDDDWAELARELARDKPQPTEPARAADESEVEPNEVVADTTYSMDEAADAGSDTAPDGAEEPGPDGQPGTGKKRRRRRRRRRRTGDQPADSATPPGASEVDEAPESGESESAEEELEPAEAGYSDESEEELDTELVAVDADSDDDAGGELLRDLIANWNVPSWDDVVGGLYRPER